MRGTSIIGGVAVLLLLGFAGALSFGLTGAVLGPIVGSALFFGAIKAFAAIGADDGRDRRRLVEETAFRETPAEKRMERRRGAV